jgi:hypothetical protein
MRSVQRTPLDRRRRLRPRDYVADPYLFGLEPCAAVLPEDGDVASQQIALVQHQLVLAWRRAGRRPRSGAICQRFGISPSTWSRITLGQSWATGTGLAALVHAVITQPRRRAELPPAP